MTEYNISWSGGKDSTASVILAHLHDIPVKNIYTVEIDYDKGISATPYIQEFKERCIETFKTWGYNTIVLKPRETYKESFTHIVTRGKPEHNGLMRGGCLSGMCYFTREKMNLLKKIDKSVPQIIGIAIDEPKRLERIQKPDISLLARYDLTESDAMNICIDFDMVSPLYGMGFKRDGCFFCPNGWKHLKTLRANYPEIYNDYKSLWYDNEKMLYKGSYIYNKSFKDVFNYAEEETP